MATITYAYPLFYENFHDFVHMYWQAAESDCQLRILSKTKFITVQGLSHFLASDVQMFRYPVIITKYFGPMIGGPQLVVNVFGNFIVLKKNYFFII
jgi:hypothetical protein